MAILASLPGLNLFSSLPSTPPPDDNTTPSTSHSPLPPIPIPKYPPPLRRSKKSQNFTPNPAFKISHRQTKYYKPVKEGQVISSEGDRSVLVGESGVSYLLPGAPFQFQFSYSETPKEKPIAIREPAFLPFAPPTMSRPWTGKGPLKKSKKKIPLFESINSPPPDKKGVKYLEMPGPFPYGKYPKVRKTREEILGEPLKRWEIRMMIKPHLSDNRQVNIGRDGLTHNMLELIHTHWRRSEVCKVKCKGVPTVDMNNVCRVLEEKSGGKIIHRVGGVVYLYRGRNYDSRTRPQYPLMLWKPATPVYPKLIQEAPEGLTRQQANELRNKGKNLLPIYKLAKNGVYITLVRDVRQAFEGSPLVKIDCKGMHASDYKKIGAKLKELVPCVLLSFDEEQILMWRGKDWKSMYPGIPLFSVAAEGDTEADSDISGKHDGDCSEYAMKAVSSSPKMMSLWKKAIESSKAMLLDEIGLGPDALLKVVEEFDIVSQAAEHSYPALISSRNEDGTTNSMAAFDSNSPTNDYGDDYFDNEDVDDDDEYYDDNSFEDVDSTVPLGSLPVDRIAKKLYKK